MNVQANLATHPKFTMFRKAVGAGAAEYLLRLWGHCQTMQRGENWGRMEARMMSDYVEAVCAWTGEPGKLFEALARKFCGKPGWVHVKKKAGALIVTNWEEHNGSLLKAWDNGGKGGRPLKPGDNPRVKTPKPGDNPRVTRREPHENPIGEDWIGEDWSGVGTEGARRPSIGAAGEADFPEVVVPSVAEVVTFGAGGGGDPGGLLPALPPGVYGSTSLGEKPAPDQLARAFGTAELVANGIGSGGENKKMGHLRLRRGADKAQLMVELEQERDPVKRAELRKRLEAAA